MIFTIVLNPVMLPRVCEAVLVSGLLQDLDNKL